MGAALIHRATNPTEEAVIATYAWDRLSVDPIPGPRGPADFDNLERLGPTTFRITSATRPHPPSGSTLPQLADQLRESLVLLDPTNGATGLQQQLAELIELYAVDSLTVVDIGGDAIARGNEPGLRSPLADALILAACVHLDVLATLLVAGPGLDGELSEAEALDAIGRKPSLILTAHDVEAFRSTLDWHPSEATALLAAAAIGLRGAAEIRDAGTRVDLTDNSPAVYELPITDAVEANPLVRQLVGTSSLKDAEAVARTTIGFSEIDYERKKGTRLWNRPSRGITPEHIKAVAAFEQQARSRGIHYTTFRRIAEAISGGTIRPADLRARLLRQHPERSAWPLWRVSAEVKAAADNDVVPRIDYLDDPNAPTPNSIVPATNVAVTDDDGRVLLIRRTDNGNYALPGGGLDLGESLPQAAVRETREETGVAIEITGLVGIYTNPNHLIEYTSNGEVRQEFAVVFTGRPVGGHLATSDEASEVLWVAPTEIPNLPVHPSMRRRIEHFLEHRSQPYLG